MKIKHKSQENYLDFTKKSIINKMKAGAYASADDYNFNTPEFRKTFLQLCKYINVNAPRQEFKVFYKKINTLSLILFGVNLEIINGSYYLPYIYYLYKDTVKFKKININQMGAFNFEDVTFEQLMREKLNGETYTSLLFDFISNPERNNIISNKKNITFENLLKKLNEKIIENHQKFLEMPQQYQQQQMQPQVQQSYQQPYQRQIQSQVQQSYQRQIQPQVQQLYQPQMQPQIQQPYQREMQQLYPQQMQQSYHQQQIPQKIKQLTEEFNTLIKYQNKILSNPFPTNKNKDDIREMTIHQQQLKENIKKELEIISDPIIKNILQNQLQQLTNRERQIKLFKNKKGIFNITDKTDIYICDDPTIEVLIKSDGNIFFGYNQNLILKTSDGLYKFYYKYSYRNGKFFELKTNLEEKEIVISLIPTYDILCLYFATKDLPNRRELQQNLQKRIDEAKANISKTGEAFFKLDHSNFDKEDITPKIQNPTLEQNKITNVKHKNFGKVKKRRVTEKTYIFFGTKTTNSNLRHVSPWFSYVCFREDNNVYFIEKSKLNEKKLLYNFPYIYPLEDLISFILLRRMITGDTKFADIIYSEALRTIKTLKTIKLTEKITKNKNPGNWEYGKNNRLKPKAEYYKKREEETKKLQQTALLPRSSQIVKIFNNF